MSRNWKIEAKETYVFGPSPRARSSERDGLDVGRQTRFTSASAKLGWPLCTRRRPKTFSFEKGFGAFACTRYAIGTTATSGAPSAASPNAASSVPSGMSNTTVYSEVLPGLVSSENEQMSWCIEYSVPSAA